VKPAFLAGLVLVAVGRAVGQESAPAALHDSIRARYEGYAADVTLFTLEDFLYVRRDDAWLEFKSHPPAAWYEWERVWRELEDRSVPAEAIIPLTKHADPKVRCLAALALFARADHTLLPHLATLLDDTATCFSDAETGAVGQRIPPRPVQVRGIAIEAVRMWGANDRLFAEWWAARKDRAWIASSFVVRLHRTGYNRPRAGGPKLPYEVERIKEVRRAIDALPEPDRDWVLLWVWERFSSDGKAELLATNADLVAAAKRLGPEKLMAALSGKMPVDDPDMAGRPGENQLVTVVLRNAAEVLRPEDADALLALGPSDERRRPLWIIASAAVRPDRAKALLEDAAKTFKGSGRHEIALGLWRILGETESDYLAEWFYSHAGRRHGHHGERNAFMIGLLPGIRGPADRKLVARIVRDPRLDQLSDSERGVVTAAVNRWAPFAKPDYQSLSKEEQVRQLRESLPKWENP
jgi:hypothetical protein